MVKIKLRKYEKVDKFKHYYHSLKDLNINLFSFFQIIVK